MSERELFRCGEKFSVKNKIRLIELFGGVGAQSMALRDIGADFEHYRLCEFDKYPVASYNAIHGTDFKPSDIRDLTGKDLGIVDVDKFTYILTYSFPCFTGDTFVLTDKGLKQIKDVCVGDNVLTHTNEYKTVLASACTGEKNIMTIKALGITELKTTENHKFYVREMYWKYPRYENGKRGQERHFKEAEWKECKKLTKNHYLGIAINQKSVMPKWDGITFEWTDGRKPRHKNEIKKLLENHSFWWTVGRYLGDGWHRKQGGIIICCSKKEIHEITPHLRNCGFVYSVVEEGAIYKIHIALKELELFLEPFGRGAENKRIPGFMFDMPVNYLESFLEGYISADGCISGDGIHRLASVSKELIYGTAQLVAKVYKQPYKIYETIVSKTHIIENRTVNQRPLYELRWKTKSKKQDKAFYENGYIWTPVRTITDSKKKEKVYDITVEDSHSFTANGVIAHNCQDLSLAGKQAGMKKDSGTRSGLLWEVERLLSETENLPQVLLMENVPQVIAKKNIDDFNQWLDFLKGKGYSNYYKVLNAKDYGIAQNRNRCFMVSLLGDYDFEFPEPVPLETRLVDYLEDEVEDKYYVNSEKAKLLIEKLIERGVLNDERKQTFLMSNKEAGASVGISPTLLSRDYKGFGYNKMAAVAEKFLGNINGDYSTGYAGGVWDKNAISPTLRTMQGGGNQPHIICGMRGRNPDNPSDRTPGISLEQRLEPNTQGISNALTTVQKDNLVLESDTETGKQKPICLNSKGGRGGIEGLQPSTEDRIYSTKGVSTAVTTCFMPNILEEKQWYRLRKLTPRECWRLMGFTDADFDRAASVNSNSQLYKEAGNSIVKTVLMAIFRQLDLPGVKKWNEEAAQV